MQKTYNILVLATSTGGSLTKLMDSLSVDFSKTKWGTLEQPTIPMFNVTLLTGNDNDKMRKKAKGNDLLTIVEMDHRKIIGPEGPRPFEMVAMENNLIDTWMRGKNPELAARLAGPYDAVAASIMPYDRLVAKAIGVPSFAWGMYLPDPLQVTFQQLPWTEMSCSLPTMHMVPRLLSLGHQHVINRLVSNTIASMMNLVVFSVFYPRRRFSSDGEQALKHYDSMLDDFYITDGILGIRDMKQDPGNVMTVIPPLRSSSQYRKSVEKELS